jgi:hypothetical protein
MLKKLLMFAITSGLAAKLYKSYTEKQAASRSPASAGSKPVARKPAARKQA